MFQDFNYHSLPKKVKEILSEHTSRLSSGAGSLEKKSILQTPTNIRKSAPKIESNQMETEAKTGKISNDNDKTMVGSKESLGPESPSLDRRPLRNHKISWI